MIGRTYHEKKTAVLDICKRYLCCRGDAKDGVDVDFLKIRIKAVEDGRYVLAVVGEVKAGKSTLINALLGEPVLPTGVLQTSSAIVEICKSEKKYTEVHYPGGRSETVYDDPSTPDLDEASEHLRQVGKVLDEYRSSPEYGEGRPPEDIPTKITFGFPLKYAFEGLRLVDSPGVNAVGGLQDATHEYIREANAVLFVHSLDSPVESASFRKFVNEIVPDRTLDTLFLVLTKSGNNSSGAILKVEEARRLYAEKINQDRILHVDSLLKIVSDEIEKFDSAASLKKHYRQQEQDFKAEKRNDEASIFEAKRKLLNNVLDDIDDDPEHEPVQTKLRRSSNFDKLEHLIDDFSSRAPWIQLASLLDSVKSGYDNQIAEYEQNLDAWKKKRKHPQTFENDMSEMQSRLDEYQHSLSDFGERVTQDFTGKDSSYDKKLEQVGDKYLNQLRSARSLDAARRGLENFYNAMGSLGDKVAEEIGVQFKEELERLGGEFKAKHRITVPTIDISAIELKTKREAYIKHDVPRDPKGFWEWTQKILTLGLKEFTEEKDKYSDEKHLSKFQSEATKRIQKTSGDFPSLVSNLANNYVKSFKSDLNALIASRKGTLEEIKKSKAENEEISKNIKRAERKKKDIMPQVDQINDILRDIR